MPDRARKRRIVFAGGGHAHLYSLARTGELVRRGFEVTLMSPSPYLYYSGMATGVISGSYAPDEHRIEVRQLVEEGGGEFVEGRVREIRTEDRKFVLETGEAVPYDAASVCLGSEVAASDSMEGVVAVKPVERTGEIRNRLLGLGENHAPGVLVIGGGAAGCEVAANSLALLDRLGMSGEVTIVEKEKSLLPQAPEKAQREITHFLHEKGAKVLTDTVVERCADGIARTGDGRGIPCDVPVLATGVSPPGVFRASGLAVGRDGGLWVDRHLRSAGDERLFGGGDCISFRGGTLPKLGVFAVRQGPVIFRNLLATLEGGRFTAYRPQRRFLYVLDLGDGTDLAVYGSLVWRGWLAWKLKDRIDRKFIEEHRRQAK